MKRLSLFIAFATSALISFSQTFSDPILLLPPYFSQSNWGEANKDYIVTGDFDGDGLEDFISVGRDDIAFNRNLGNGDFDSPLFMAYPGNTTISSQTDRDFVLDIENDGDLDLIRLNGNSSWMYLNNGNGTFQNPTDPFNQSETFSFYDIGEDGLMDVIYREINGADVEIWARMNNGDGTFGLPALTTLSDPLPLYDFDGDGDMDGFMFSGSEIFWVELDAGEEVNTHLFTVQPAGGSGEFDKIIEDIDGDGDLDIAIAYDETSNNGIWLYENDGSGTFTEYAYLDEYGTFQLDEAVLHALDFEGDGDLDFYYIDDLGGDPTPALYLNNGDFSTFSSVFVGDFVPTRYQVGWIDVDADGDLDLLNSGGNLTEVYWIENDEIDFGCGDITSCSYDDNASPDPVYCCYESGCPYPNAENYNELACCIEVCEYLFGCTDPWAPNYDPDAVIDDGSCTYPEGCTAWTANNYDPEAWTDDGSCIFDVVFQVFYDENEDGFMNGLDYPLPFQTIEVSTLDLTLITNDDGEAVVYGLSDFPYQTAELINTSAFPINTTPSPVTFWPGETPIRFGVSNEFPEYAICVDLYPNGIGYPCDDESLHNICFRNMGNLPVDGEVVLSYDDLFVGHQEITPISSVNGSTVTMDFDNLVPGQMYFYDIDLITPDVDFIGEVLASEVEITGYYDGNQVAYGEQDFEMPITCAYDPNDKFVFPNGYTDEHFVENDQELEYLVRFQNTGNAPATDVHVIDTLDANLDLSTFRVVANSHSVMTTLNHQTRVVDFYFQNIMLPDSVNNESESHGLVSFAITPLPDLPVETEINNTANIYFDNNPPIVTNTTWSKIWGCELMVLEALQSTETSCQGGTIEVSTESTYVEEMLWTVGSEEIGTEDSLEYAFIESGTTEVLLTYSNPFCVDTFSAIVDVEPGPDVPVLSASEINLCEGFTEDVQAESDYDVQWLLDGESISDQNQITIAEVGVYSVFAISGECISDLGEVNVTSEDISPPELSDVQTEFCEGDEVSVLASSEYEIQWLLDGIEFSTESEITIGESGAYAVLAFDENCESESVEIDFSMIENPEVPEVSSQVINFCEGESGVVTASSNSELEWYSGNTLLSSAQSYNFSDDGTYYVQAVIGECESSPVYIFVNELETPLPPEIESELGALCAGDLTPVSAVSDYNVVWYFQGQQISESSTIEVDEAGTYTVIAFNGDCPSESSSEYFDVLESPPIPVIQYEDDILSTYSLTGVTYQWFLDGNPISGAVGTTLEPEDEGVYSLEVTYENGCSSTSGFINIETGIEELDSFISVFPNPVTSDLNVNFGFHEVQTISIIDGKGSVVKTFSNLENSISLVIGKSDLSSGVYFLEVTKPNSERSFIRLIVM